jgi:hypothetical protein
VTRVCADVRCQSRGCQRSKLERETESKGANVKNMLIGGGAAQCVLSLLSSALRSQFSLSNAIEKFCVQVIVVYCCEIITWCCHDVGAVVLLKSLLFIVVVKFCVIYVLPAHAWCLLSYGPPWAHCLGGYQDRLLGGPLGLLGLCHTAPDGVGRKDYGGEVLV